MFLRKDVRGADSFGNCWDEDGAVVDVPDEQAVVLLDIPGAGFSVVDGPVEGQDDDEDDDPADEVVTEPGPAAPAVEVTEPAPAEVAAEPAPKRAPARRKAAAPKA